MGPTDAELFGEDEDEDSATPSGNASQSSDDEAQKSTRKVDSQRYALNTGL